MASWHRKLAAGVAVHPGRGGQYCPAAHQKLFNKTDYRFGLVRFELFLN